MTNGERLLQSVRQLRLVEDEHLTRVGEELHTCSGDARSVADLLCGKGLLTPFQAECLLQGQTDQLILGQYRLLERLGSGGMGQVFKAYHRLLKTTRAIKVIHPDCLTTQSAKERFFQEAQAAAALHHPNIVVAHDASEEGDRCFFVMEYVPGTDLGRILRRNPQMPFADACEYVRQAALGLQHAHEKGMVHRDIKPGNLILSHQGVVKILDMGLARVRAGDDRDDGEDRLTEHGMMMGTPDYMAPEQAENARTVDIRADIYSLGCTLYELLTGRPPFAGGGLGEKLRRHHAEVPLPVHQFRGDIPPTLSLVVSRMLEKRPQNRQQTPVEVAEALRPYCQGAQLLRAADTMFSGERSHQPGTSDETSPLTSGKREDTNLSATLDLRPTAIPTNGIPGTTSPATDLPSKDRTVVGRRSNRLVIAGVLTVLIVPPLTYLVLSNLKKNNTGDQHITQGDQKKDKDPTKDESKPPVESKDKTTESPNRDKTSGPPDKDKGNKPPVNPVEPSPGLARPGKQVAAAIRSKPSEVVAENRDKSWRQKILGEEVDTRVRRSLYSRDGQRLILQFLTSIKVIPQTGTKQIELSPGQWSFTQTRLETDIETSVVSPDGKRIAFSVLSLTDLPVRGKANRTVNYDTIVEWGGGDQPLLLLGEYATENRDNRAIPSTQLLAYAGDGILLAGSERQLSRWNLPTNKRTLDSFLPTALPSRPSCLAGSPDGAYAFVGMTNDRYPPQIYRLDAQVNTPVGELKGVNSMIRTAVFANPTTLLTGDADGGVAIWTLPDRRDKDGKITQLASLERWHQSAVRTLAVSSKGNLFATGGNDGFLVIGRIGESRELYRERVDGAEIEALSFTDEDRAILFVTKRHVGRIVLDGQEGLARQTASTDQALTGIGKK